MTKLFPASFLGLFYCWVCCFLHLQIPGLQVQCRPVLQQGLVCIFLCTNSFFNILVPPRCSLLITRGQSKPLLVARFCSWWNDCRSKQRHSISMSSETSGSSRNFADILDANCFLTSLSSKVSHLILYVTLTTMFFCLTLVSKIVRNIQPSGDQLTVQHRALLERPTR